MNKLGKTNKKEEIIMKKLNEHYKIILVFIVILSGIFLICNKNSDNVTLDEVRLKDTKEGMFAFMLENEDGQYIKSEENTWPSMGYKYNVTLSGCIDGNNNEVKDALTYNEATKKVSLKTKSTVYCYLYFDKYSAGDKLLEDKPNGLQDTAVADLYRFVGTAENEPNNYICFGRRGKCSSVGEYMYRIIGIEENTGRLKLIKNSAVSTSMTWHSNYADNAVWDNANNGKQEAELHQKLNGTDFLNNSDYLPSSWKNKISDTSWNIGDSHYDNSNGYGNGYTNSGGQILEWEQKEVANTASKIGLMYLSDYYYSLDGTGNLDCTTFNNKNEYQTCKTSWLHISNNGNTQDATSMLEWTISRYGQNGSNYAAWYITIDGLISHGNLNNTAAVRPVFYLNSGEQIVNGTGIINDPFVLDTSDIQLTESEQFIQDKLGTIPEKLLETNTGDLKYRFVGTQEESDNIRNYVCFGSTDNCANKKADYHMYRIIGITEKGNLKIQRNRSIKKIGWHSGYQSDVQWQNSSIYKNTLTPEFNDNQVNITTEMKNKIDITHLWNTGDVKEYDSAIDDLYGEKIYEQEQSSTYSGEIGLAYLSDYYFAYEKDGTQNCTIEEYCPSWMIPKDTEQSSLWNSVSSEWTMTRYGLESSNYRAWRVFSTGRVYWNTMTSTFAVRPVFYLKDNVTISSGTGTLDDPFIIDMTE